MSVLETILTRAMNDPEFADLLFTDSEKALTEYNLAANVLAKFKSMSRTEFETISTEERLSLAKVTGNFALDLDGVSM